MYRHPRAVLDVCTCMPPVLLHVELLPALLSCWCLRCIGRDGRKTVFCKIEFASGLGSDGAKGTNSTGEISPLSSPTSK